MDRQGHLGVEAAARFEGRTYAAYVKTLRRRKIFLSRAPEDRRRRLVPVSALTPTAYSKLLNSQAAPLALPPDPNIEAVAQLQPFLPFRPPTETERGLAAAIPPAIPKHQQPYVRLWAKILAENRNGTWKRHRGKIVGGVLVNHARDYVRGTARLYGVGASTIYSKLQILRELEREGKQSEILERLLPKPRPGRPSFFADPENSWAGVRLRELYLNQARLPAKHAHELLCEETKAKQRVGLGAFIRGSNLETGPNGAPENRLGNRNSRARGRESL